MKYKINGPWTGSCYGIATTMALVYKQYLMLSEICDMELNENSTCYYDLDSPAADLRLREALNYYHLLQCRCNSTAKCSSGINLDLDLPFFLHYLVASIWKDDVVVFGYKTKKVCHAILAVGVEETENGWIVKLYDENTASLSGDSRYPVRKPGFFTYMDIDSDFQTFSFRNTSSGLWHGDMVAEDNFKFLEFWRISDINAEIPFDPVPNANDDEENIVTLASAKEEDTDIISFSPDQSFSITSDKNGVLNYDGETNNFTGDMSMLDLDIYAEGGHGKWIVTIPASDTYSVSKCSPDIDLQMYNDTDFLALSGSDIGSAELCLGDSVKISGADGKPYTFKAAISTKEVVAENETNLISIAGSATEPVIVSEDPVNSQVTAKSTAPIEDVQTYSYIQTDIIPLTGVSDDPNMVKASTDPKTYEGYGFEGHTGGGTPPAPVTYYGVIVSATPPEGGTVAGGATYSENDSVTVTATPNTGYHFVKWTENGIQVSTDEAYTFTAAANRVLVAEFEQNTPEPATYTITVQTDGNGIASASAASAAAGTEITLTHDANSGYHFKRWEVVSGKVTIENGRFTMSGGAVTIKAAFERNRGGGGGSYSMTDYYMLNLQYYTLTFRSNGGSRISSVTRAENRKLDLTAAKYQPVRDGYDFTGWYADKDLTKKLTEIRLNGDSTVYAGWKESRSNTDTGAWGNPFTDVKESDWFYDDVALCHMQDLMKGTSATTFSPDADTTRGMIVSILYRMEKEPAVKAANPFTDVADGKFYTNAVLWAAENNIVGGYGNGLFGPEDKITREQLASILCHYARYKDCDASVGEEMNIFSYKDAFRVSEWAVPAMQWACGAGILHGSDGNLMPQDGATRAQAAAMLIRFLNSTAK